MHCTGTYRPEEKVNIAWIRIDDDLVNLLLANLLQHLSICRGPSLPNVHLEAAARRRPNEFLLPEQTYRTERGKIRARGETVDVDNETNIRLGLLKCHGERGREIKREIKRRILKELVKNNQKRQVSLLAGHSVWSTYQSPPRK